MKLLTCQDYFSSLAKGANNTNIPNQTVISPVRPDLIYKVLQNLMMFWFPAVCNLHNKENDDEVAMDPESLSKTNRKGRKKE